MPICSIQEKRKRRNIKNKSLSLFLFFSDHKIYVYVPLILKFCLDQNPSSAKCSNCTLSHYLLFFSGEHKTLPSRSLSWYFNLVFLRSLFTFKFHEKCLYAWYWVAININVLFSGVIKRICSFFLRTIKKKNGNRHVDGFDVLLWCEIYKFRKLVCVASVFWEFISGK